LVSFFPKKWSHCSLPFSPFSRAFFWRHPSFRGKIDELLFLLTSVKKKKNRARDRPKLIVGEHRAFRTDGDNVRLSFSEARAKKKLSGQNAVG
jgi:hypothetical protein